MSERAATTQVGSESEPRNAVGEVGRAYKAASVAMRRLRGRQTHRQGQLSYAQYGLLFGLAGGCELSAKELAEAADLTPGTVTQMLEALEASGLVERARSESDKRVVLTRLTERGQQVIDERRAKIEPAWRAALAEFDDEQLRSAAAVLNALASYFDDFDQFE